MPEHHLHLPNRLALVVMLLLLAFAGVPAVHAQESVIFRVTAPSMFARTAPNESATALVSIFAGDWYPAIARNGDGSWLLISIVGLPDGAWVKTDEGEVTGDVASLPVSNNVIDAAVVGADEAADACAIVDNANLSRAVVITEAQGRADASPDADMVAALFPGQRLHVLDSTTVADGVWLNICLSSQGEAAWVPESATGPFTEADAAAEVAITPAGLPGDGRFAHLPTLTQLGFTPNVPDAARDMYHRFYEYGRRPDMLTVTGDSNMESARFGVLLETGLIDLTRYPQLRDDYRFWRASYDDKSLGVYAGFNTVSVFSTLYSDPLLCKPDETPLACELRRSNASVLVVALGTNDYLNWPNFENNYRPIVEYSLGMGVVPILVTKADRFESEQADGEAEFINNVIRRLAAEYKVPLIDMWPITQQMPKQGVVSDGFHLTEDANQLRLLALLATLDALR